jgi:hypothetical protein
MSATMTMLPPGFSDLERFAAEWALPSERARNQFRVKRTLAELEDFYQTVFPRMDALCDCVDQFTLEAMPRPAARLLQLGLMLMEVVPAVEVYRAPDVPNAIAFERLQIISPNDPIKILDN